MSESNKPRVTITYCHQCQWLLRAGWMAQELLSTFRDDLGEVVLIPTTGGVFQIHYAGELIWDLPSLLPGQIRRYRVQCRCLGPGRACNIATVTAADGQKTAQEACLEIRGEAPQNPPAGGQATAPQCAGRNATVSVSAARTPW